MKYRIIKRERSNDYGETKTTFEVQQKSWYFPFWISARILTHYFTYTDNQRPRNGALLITRLFSHPDLESAEKLMKHLQSDRFTIYKGALIETVLTDNELKPSFINRNNLKTWNGSFCYEYAPTLNELKKMIDRRKGKETVIVMS